jgi:nicotinate-nucleotide adenylyltransferase
MEVSHMQTRKIGIMGGTFNPVHYAHLRLAECAREQFHLDRVIFIPSGFSYLKKDQNVPEGELRYQLCKMATSGNPYFTVSRIEIDRPGDTYTIETIQQLADMYPGDELYFILGADSLNMIDKWVRFDEILTSCTVLAAVRDETDMEKLKKRISELVDIVPGAHIEPIQMGHMNISSTMIRENIRTGKSVRYLLPDDCIAYIAVKNLYSGMEEQNIMDAPDRIC